MTNPSSTSSASRSVIAVAAGLTAVVILSTLTDMVMHATGIIPPGAMWDPWDNALALAYRCLFTVAGGYLTARLAPSAPMAHVLALGLIGTAIGIAGVFATAGLNLGPRWYPIAVAASGLPCTWLGGLLNARRARLGGLS
jgi:protein-S-isoprenylcysteine O-methyltransferase Ste14